MAIVERVLYRPKQEREQETSPPLAPRVLVAWAQRVYRIDRVGNLEARWREHWEGLAAKCRQIMGYDFQADWFKMCALAGGHSSWRQNYEAMMAFCEKHRIVRDGCEQLFSPVPFG